jgi:quercetin dioxygenase-like cupin family protein
MTPATDRVLVLDADDADHPPLAIVEGEGSAHAIIWPGMGAALRSLHMITLEPGARTIDLRHEGEAVYFVRDGVATVQDDDAGEAHEVPAGRMFFVEPGTRYAVHAADGRVVIVGGPSPPDPSLYEGLA